MHLRMSSATWRPFCLGLNVLTHWPMRDGYLLDIPWICPQTNATRLYWWLVNIGSCNGLVPYGVTGPQWVKYDRYSQRYDWLLSYHTFFTMFALKLISHKTNFGQMKIYFTIFWKDKCYFTNHLCRISYHSVTTTRNWRRWWLDAE